MKIMHHLFIRFQLTGLFAGLLLLTGCEDSSARQRAEIQEQLNNLSAELASIIVSPIDTGDENLSDRERKLRRLAGDTGKLSDGAPGQLAARHLLSASIYHELALINLAHADDVEQEQSIQYAHILGQIRAAGDLNTTAQALEKIQTHAQRDQLDQVHASAQMMLSHFSEQLAELDDPIAERDHQNTQDATEVSRLREEANNYRRESTEAGYTAGFSSFERSVELNRQADLIERDIALRDIDLTYQYQPEHDLAQARVDQMHATMAATNASREDLDELAATIAQSVEQTRRAVEQYKQEFVQLLRAVDEQTGGELNDLYASAQSDLDKAAREAKQAVSKARQTGSSADRGSVSGENAAKLVAVQINEALGQYHWRVARIADERRLIYDLLIQAGDLAGDTSDFQAKYEQAVAEYERALNEAQIAFETAKNTMPPASGPNRIELEEYSRSLDVSLSALTGGSLDLSQFAPPSQDRDTGGQPSSPTAATSTTKGAATPEELRDVVLNSDPSDLRSNFQSLELLIPLDRVTGLSQDEMRVSRSSIRLMRSMARLDSVMQQTFGKNLDDVTALQSQLAMFGVVQISITSADLQNMTDDSGEINIAMSNGMSMPMPISRLDGRWYMGNPEKYTGEFEMLQGNAEALAMLAAAAQRNSAFAKLFEDTAGNIEANRIKTFEDLNLKIEDGFAMILDSGAGSLQFPGGG